jgi:hypothetical protein
VRSAVRTGRLYPPGSISGTHFYSYDRKNYVNEKYHGHHRDLSYCKAQCLNQLQPSVASVRRSSETGTEFVNLFIQALVLYVAEV